ncbi:MAG: citrate synthase [SAR202 cluster bacterium]|nr:citrate synthase [SAR202 cluster bacterium]
MTTAKEQYFPGLEGVIAGETAISTISGGLQYRGYGIEELATRSNFDEVAYLLLHGGMPTPAELAGFRKRLSENRVIPDAVVDFIRKLPRNAPAMDVLRTGVSALAHFDPDTDSNEHAADVRKAERLLARIPTLIGVRSRLKRGLEPIPPRADLDFSANLIHMVTGKVPPESHRKAFEVSLILYAEHEYNASTFTARVTASTLAGMYGAITAAIAALKGPLHGGANERAVEVLQSVGKSSNAEKWIRDSLARKDRIMGFGHRIYKVEDPRARILKNFCRELAGKIGGQASDWEGVADIIERVIWDEKKLPPNVDWPAGRLYHMMGLEVELYTPIFVSSRITGWAAHVIEQHDHNRLIRPVARYTGPADLKYVGIDQRQ